MPNLMAFLSYILITTFTPGPNVIMSMTNAAKYGVKKSLPFNIGVFIGFTIIMILSSIFSITLISVVPSIKPIMSYIGAIYILYMAWKIYKSKPNSHTDNDKATTSIISGLLLQFINPKVILFCITTVTTFIIPYYRSPIYLFIFSVSIAFTGFIATLCWALFGSIFQKFIVKNDRIVNAIMALLLVYCAFSLLL